jgi:hypothetical protein
MTLTVTIQVKQSIQVEVEVEVNHQIHQDHHLQAVDTIMTMKIIVAAV